jgi:hypothetical protein
VCSCSVVGWWGGWGGRQEDEKEKENTLAKGLWLALFGHFQGNKGNRIVMVNVVCATVCLCRGAFVVCGFSES